MGVDPKIGGFYPPKWMVKIMENPMNKWMIWGEKTLFLVQHPNPNTWCFPIDIQNPPVIPGELEV